MHLSDGLYAFVTIIHVNSDNCQFEMFNSLEAYLLNSGVWDDNLAIEFVFLVC